MADICHFEGDNVFDEFYSWPIALTAVWFKVQYVTHNIWASIAALYLFEAFVLAMNLLFNYFDEKSDSSSQMASKYVFGWFSAPEGSFVCYQSAVIALIAAPLLGITAALLWHWGVEYLVGAPYDTPPKNVQRGILWLTVLIVLALSSNALFAPTRKDLIYRKHVKIRDDEIDVSMLFGALMCIALASYIPFSSAQRNGLQSLKYLHAMRGYLIFCVFFLFIVFFSAVFGPAVGGYRSSYMRALFSLAILWFACVFVWVVRTSRSAYRHFRSSRRKRPPNV